MKKRLAKIDRIATEFEKVAKVLVAWGNQDLAKAILKIDPDIIKELKRFGVEQINGSGYVIHHFENAPTTYLSKSRNPDYNQSELAKTLNDKNYNPALREEMIEEIKKYTVLLPAWFHNWCTKHKQQIKNYTSRIEYYNLMAAILKNEKICKNISELQFNDSTIYSALKSIQNLATTADKDYKEKIIDDLKILFEKLQKNVKIYLRSFYFGPYSHYK